MNLEEWKRTRADPGFELTQIDFADESSGLFKSREMYMGEISDVYTVWWKNVQIIRTGLLNSAFVLWNTYRKPAKKGEKKMPKEKTNREIYEEYLRKTGRAGVEDLLAELDTMGFYEAPASGGNHMHEQGGLLQHSLNVLYTAEKMSVALLGAKNITDEMRNSIVIAALLHDIGKCGDFGKKMYVENILKSGKQSEAKPYKRNPDLTGVPHAVRSVKLATLFIDLSEDEEWAILTHDGMYDYARTFLMGNETPLFMIIHWADMWASKVLEGVKSEGEEE